MSAITIGTASDLPIVPDPRFQSEEERKRDAPRMELLREIEKIVKRVGGVRDFNHLMEIKKQAELILKNRKAKEEKKENKPGPKPTRKSKFKDDGFPRLVRRNARRGSGVHSDGATWTEEVIF